MSDSRLLVTPLKLLILSLALKEVVSKILLYISLLWKYTNGFGLILEDYRLGSVILDLYIDKTPHKKLNIEQHEPH
jgi:hypothetical protein